MPRQLNDYRCTSCGTTAEFFVDNTAQHVTCQVCEQRATKVQRPVRSTLNPHDPAFPSAFAKWETDRHRRIAHERKDSAYDPSYG